MLFKTQIAYDNWKKKYRYKDETEVETFQRVARALANVEKVEDREKWYDKFLKVLLKIDKETGLPTGLKCTPGGRITANAGTAFGKATLMNCYISGPVSNATIKYTRKSQDDLIEVPITIKSDESPDDLHNIFLTILEQAKTLAAEGGYGINFDFIRPRNSLIKGTGIRHPGVVSYMEIWNSVSECIVKGTEDGYVDKIKNYFTESELSEVKSVIKSQTRKGAMLSALSCSHPDIEEFVRAKQVPGRLTKFNISVVLDDEFMRAVENNEFYEQKFNGKVYKKVKARDLYNLIMESTYNRGEPGVLFVDNMHRNNPIAYLGKANCTNPCIVGSSIIAVADGRNGVSIEQLAKEGKDVPVYSKSMDTGTVEIKFGRNPRKTGEKKEVWKLTFDDGSSLIATPDHSVLLKSMEYKQLKDLQPGESIVPFNSYVSNGYRQIAEASVRKKKNGLHLSRRQYRLIFSFHNPDAIITKDHRIHHSNYDSTDDRIEFLKLCTKQEHSKFHDISGKNNPMFKLKDRKKYHDNMSKAVGGLNNPRAFKIETKEIFNRLLEHTKQIGRKLSTNELFSFCKNSEDIPTNLQTFRMRELQCKNMTELRDKLEHAAFCNHKVEKVEFHGYEDVYNITVDDNHNYMVITAFDDSKFMKSSGVCIKNCGEIPGLPSITTVCLLGSLNLTQYVQIVDGYTVFDFDQYADDIRVFTRMLDNVNDIANNPLPSYDWVTRNLRQIGMGVNGLGSALMMLRIPYNSEEAVEFTKKICQLKENITVQTSALLAKEKGVFAAYDKDLYTNTEYFKSERLTEETKRLVRKYGMRNAKTTTNPPLGNSAVICDNVSNGIEPVFRLEYERKMICEWPENLNADNVKEVLTYYKEKDFEYWQGDFNETTYYYEPHNRGLCKVTLIRDYGYQWYLDNKDKLKTTIEEKKFLISTKELSIDDHLNIHEVVQFYNNQSVSKTSNLPNNYPFKSFLDLYMKAWKKGLNGFTTYRTGSMESVLSDVETREIIKKDIKLPEEFLNGPTTIIKREGIKFYIHFSFLPHDVQMKFPVCLWIYTNCREKSASVVCNKAARELAKLALKCNIEKSIIEDTINKLKIEQPHNRLSRMISLCLRHNIAREDILVTLTGIEEDNISTLLTAVRKFIGKTIKDGTKLIGLVCPECKSTNMVMESGCKMCADCSNTSCG